MPGVSRLINPKNNATAKKRNTGFGKGKKQRTHSNDDSNPSNADVRVEPEDRSTGKGKRGNASGKKFLAGRDNTSAEPRDYG